MRARLRRYGLAALRAGHELRRRPLAAGATASVLAIAVVLCGLARLAGDNLDRLGERWGGGVQMIVYLEDGVDEAGAAVVAEALRELPAVEGVDYVPPERALEQVRAELAGEGDLLAGVEVGFLPASLEVALAPGTGALAAMHPVVQRLERTPGVDGVELSGAWVERTAAFVDRLRGVGELLFALALVAGAIAVWATMRVGGAARVTQQRILDLVGASAAELRLPAVCEGALLGAVGAALAALVLALLYQHGAPAIEATLSLTVDGAELSFLSAAELASLALVGVGLGVAGGALSRGAR